MKEVKLAHRELGALRDLARAYDRAKDCPIFERDEQDRGKLVSTGHKLYTTDSGRLSIEGVGTVSWDVDGLTFEVFEVEEGGQDAESS